MPTQNDDSGTPDMQNMTDRIAKLVERSQKVWAQSLDCSGDSKATTTADPLHTLPAMTRLAQDYIDQPRPGRLGNPGGFGNRIGAEQFRAAAARQRHQ